MTVLSTIDNGHLSVMEEVRPLSVAVLVDLERTHHAGGHVKCWERLAEAAVDHPALDLTLYVLGRRPCTEHLSGNVRFVSVPPVLSTRPLQRFTKGVDVADLARFNRALARQLPGHDVWHLTHTMAFASTACSLARQVGHPLVGSVHTDVPLLTKLYLEQMLQRLPGPLGRRAELSHRLADLAASAARRHRDRILQSCEHVLASNAQDYADIAAASPDSGISMLRRGIDRGTFRADIRDRAWLADRLGIPEARPIVLFAGRVDASKGALLLADAVRQLTSAGQPVHLALAGEGADASKIQALLGPDATLLGRLDQSDLARVYASCDVLGFPSRSETSGNVVAEAMACGLPAVLPDGARTAHWLRSPGQDGVLVTGEGSAAWTAALGSLLRDPIRLAGLAQCATATASSCFPTWRRVLDQDLLPVWRHAAANRGRLMSEDGPARPHPRLARSPVGGSA